MNDPTAQAAWGGCPSTSIACLTDPRTAPDSASQGIMVTSSGVYRRPSGPAERTTMRVPDSAWK